MLPKYFINIYKHAKLYMAK